MKMLKLGYVKKMTVLLLEIIYLQGLTYAGIRKENFT